MDKKELKQYLKENLKIDWRYEGYDRLYVVLTIEPDGIKTETLLKDSYIQAYREGVEDSIRELSLL